MYLSQTKLGELSDFQTDTAAISLYVYSSAQESQDHFSKRLNQLARTVEERVANFQGPISHWISKGDYLDQLQDALLEVFVEDKGQTCCVFIAEEFFTVVDLPLQFSEFIVVDHKFFIQPLSGLLAQFERFAVLVVDHDRARLYGIHLNEIAEMEETFEDYRLPQCNDEMPAWECLSGNIINQRLRDPFQRHLKNVVDRVEDNSTLGGFDRLIIGAPQTLQSCLRHHLPRKLQDALIDSFEAETSDNTAIIRRKAELLINKHRRRREIQALAALRQARDQHLAALGAAAVTRALMAGQVRRLVLMASSQDEGWACPSGHLFGGSSCPVDLCSHCQKQLEPISSLSEALVVEALSQKLEIFHILHERETWEGHSLGAFLRHPCLS